MRKIKVTYTVHADRLTIEKKSVVLEASEQSISDLLLIRTPVTQEALTCLNLKMALYWVTRLTGQYFEPSDQVLRIREAKR